MAMHPWVRSRSELPPTTYVKGIDRPLCPHMSRRCSAHDLVHRLAYAMRGDDNEAVYSNLHAVRALGPGTDAAVVYHALDVALGFEGTRASDGRGGAPGQDGEFVEGYSTKRQTSIIRSYMTSSSVRTVCETGFNAGHSASGYLLANRKLHYYGFDLGKHNYTRRAAKYLKAASVAHLRVLCAAALFAHRTLSSDLSAHPHAGRWPFQAVSL